MYKSVEPLLENTICEAREVDGVIVSYKMAPVEGYKLHEITLDETIFDKETFEETGKIKLGYTKSEITLSALYDWETNTRKIYVKPDSDEEEVVDAEDTNIDSDMEEKAKAYDIVIGAEK